MPKTIQQSVTLPAPAAELYRTYLDPRRHAAVTGAPVTIGSKPGSTFRAFGGALSGKVLFTRPGRMIVQTWRSTNFGGPGLHSDPDLLAPRPLRAYPAGARQRGGSGCPWRHRRLEEVLLEAVAGVSDQAARTMTPSALQEDGMRARAESLAKQFEGRVAG